MECNKDEAIRAREVAESRMRINDFAGAQKLGLKAQKLFPELDNIYQLLTVCNVHCSSQNRLNGSEMDWYAILQVTRMADEAAIKKQYRKLALLLHPDKNKFPGAESAFKLIGEANRVLTDHTKRSLYEMKAKTSVKMTVPKPPPDQVNRNTCVRPQYEAPNAAQSQAMGSNVQKQGSTFANGQETFWTSCPFCSVKFQYYKDVLNRSLQCQTCFKPFIAYDLGGQGASQVPSWNHPSYPHRKEFPTEGDFKANAHSCSWKPQAGVRVQGAFGSKTTGSGPDLKTENTGRASRSKGRSNANTEKDGKAGSSMPKSDAAKPEQGKASRNAGRRGRNSVVESSESSATSSSNESEDMDIQENGGDQNFGLNGGYNRRTSSRNKRNVSYNENLSDDDDFVSPPPKASKVGKSSNTREDEVKDDGTKEEVKEKGNDHVGQNFPNGTREATDAKVSGEEVKEDEAPKVNGEFESDPEFYDCPDPEFSDFDKDKAENCYAVGQIWAIYDDMDGMPRFYARVSKICHRGFKLDITWLEPDPDDADEIDWVNEELPVACGHYKLGKTKKSADLPMFSHQVDFKEGNDRRTYVIYPRKGETWALFKDWYIGWSTEPEDHTSYKYEIVEVLSDFVDGVGVKVVYLDKIKGFVSLFHQTTREGIVSFNVPPKHIFQFSHRVPSFRMDGTERVGVPKGSLELDTAALPADLLVKCDDATNVGTANLKGMNTPKKSVDMEEENEVGGRGLKPRRSPRHCL